MSTHSRLACALCTLGLLIPAGTAIAGSGGAGYTATSSSKGSAHPGKGRSGARRETLGWRVPVRWGMKGNDVKALQRLLSHVGLFVSADGSFGHHTRMSVLEFEQRTGRTADGVLDGGDLVALYRIDKKGGFPPPPAPAPLPAGSRAKVNKNGLASVGVDAPQVVKDMIAAGNRIASKPYVYGGGHGRWNDAGYDCSGSLSYALHGAGLLKISRDSTGFESYGKAGYGRWVTIFANGGHTFMMVAGLRFDTSGASAAGSRWQTAKRSKAGYIIRHPAGL